MESLLERLSKETPSQLQARSREALDFFKDRVRNIKVSGQAFYKREAGTLTKAKRYLDGRMYTFFYDPKTKEKLPYYDRFPVVLIIDSTSTGFSGLNFHYIPPKYRAKLLDELYEFEIEDKDTEDESMRTRIRVNYNLLQSTAKMKFFRPCYKRYLTSHIEGKALQITPNYWSIITMLPLAQFEKESIRKVYSESIRSVDG